MKYASQIVCLLFLVALSSTSFGMMHMFTRKPRPLRQYQQLSPQQQRMIQTKALTTTIQSSPSFYSQFQKKFTELKAAGWNIWTRLTSRPSQAPVITSPQSITLQQPLAQPLRPSVQIIPSIPTAIDKSEISILSQLQTAQTLSEMDLALKNNAKTEQNKQQKLLNISNEQWLAMLKKEEEDFAWIKNNCFKNKNVISDDRNKIPKERYAQIIQCFKTTKLDPLSVKLVWETITTPDIFGHNAIITNGPIVNDSTTKLQQIPTITFDPDKVNALSPEEFEFELYHAITHLVQGDHDKLHLLKNTVGTEKFNQYTQSKNGKKYLTTLEENANFTLALHNKAAAHSGFATFLESSLRYFLQTMKPITQKMTNREILTKIQETIEKPKYSHIHTETITCSPPQKEIIDFIQQINATKDIETFCHNTRIEIINSLGLTEDQQAEYYAKRDAMIAHWNAHYKKTNKGTFDPEMPKPLANLISTLLKQSGLEPSSIDIKTKEALGGGFAAYKGPFKLEIPVLFINPDMPTLFTTYVVLHEIGHILSHHAQELELLLQFCAQHKIAPEKINAAELRFAKLIELEADIYLAKTYPDVAKLNYLAAKEWMKYSISSEKAAKEFPLHPTSADRVHIYQKIMNLHAQKTPPQRNFFTLIDQVREQGI